MSHRLQLVLLSAVGCLAGNARAEPEAARARDVSSTRTELTFGFMGGRRDQSMAGFVVDPGAAATPGAAALVGPFTAPPLSDAVVSGPAWEARHVQRHLRMTVGLTKPFALFRLGEGAGAYDVDGQARSVTVRALGLWDVRLGLGAEYSIRRVTGFVDVLGDVHHASAALTVDGAPVTYGAWSFGYSVRAGLRVALGGAMFVAASGEYGALGASRFGGQLMVGVAVPGE